MDIETQIYTPSASLEQTLELVLYMGTTLRCEMMGH